MKRVLPLLLATFIAMPAVGQDVDLSTLGSRTQKDGVTVNVFMAGNEGDGYVATVAVSDNGYIAAAEAYADIFSPIAVPETSFVDMDSSNGKPEVFVTRWTGGAHCCVEVTIFLERDEQWVALDGGRYDGDPEGLAPRDIDGDGRQEIATYDNAFLYRWTSYAGSYAPPAIYAIRDGKVANVTTEPGFAAYLRERLNDMGEIPESGSDRNSWLAAYAATLLLLGEDDPLDYADGAHDPEPDWGLTGCSDPEKQWECPEDKVTRVSFPEGLRAFLRETGYLEAE